MREPTVEVTKLGQRLAAVLVDQTDVVAAYLFGSRAQGRARAASDVDVAVLFDPPATGQRRLVVRADLQAATAPVTVDLLVLDDAPVAVAYRVLQRGVVVVGGDDPRRIRHAVSVMDRYHDMAPLRRVLAAGTAQRIREGRFGRP